MRSAVSDCKLNDYSDEYLIKWLSSKKFHCSFFSSDLKFIFKNC